MSGLARLVPDLPQEQRSIRAKCFHPSGSFVEFRKEEIEQSIPDRFEQIVCKYPERIAVKTRNHGLTYDALNKMANRIAHYLLSGSLFERKRIGLLVDRDAPMVACLLGVLKSGKVYVPLDPAYPVERVRQMLSDSDVGAVLTTTQYVKFAWELTGRKLPVIDIDQPDVTAGDTNPGLQIVPESLAYILYTSGSTGQSKGIMRSHANVLHFIRNYTNTLHISVADRLSQLASYSFSAAVMDIFGALLNGAALLPFDIRREGLTLLAGWLQKEEITIYHSTPTVFRHFTRTLTGEQQFPSLRLIDLGGEPVTKQDFELYRRYFGGQCLLVNGLGSTELNVSLQYFMDEKTRIARPIAPVGYPVEDTEVVLLDETGSQPELGGLGEIVIKSAYIGEGYWRQLELTREIFKRDPGSGKWWYYTGNLGRLLPDGSIEVVGRKDSQIKVRGHRIEVNEIESKLMEMEGIQEVAVTTSDNAHEDKQLIAYVAAQSQGLRLTVSTLRDYLSSALPEYMIPSAFVILEKLPLTPNGKVDHSALPPPEASRPELDTPFVAPRTRVEKQLAQIWAEVLSLDHVGIRDSFFELGGHSLAATQVISRVRNTFGVGLSFKTLFDAPTVAHMAEVIGRHQDHRAEHGSHVGATSDYSSRELVKGHRVTPTDPFIEFRKEEIEPSMRRRFEQVAAKHPDRRAVKTKSRSNH